MLLAKTQVYQFYVHSKNANFTSPGVLSSVLDLAKMFVETFQEGYNFDNWSSSLPSFYPRTNLKLQHTLLIDTSRNNFYFCENEAGLDK